MFYARMGPFTSGLYTGFMHSKYYDYDFTASWFSLLFEVIACVITSCVSYYGNGIFIPIPDVFSPHTMVWYQSAAIPIYGISFSYLIILMVTP